MVVQAAVNEVPQSDAAVVRNLAALVERMRIGQERALEELYDATVGKLYALAFGDSAQRRGHRGNRLRDLRVRVGERLALRREPLRMRSAGC
jgi:hypothetical protein